jgi:hypothetical protein
MDCTVVEGCPQPATLHFAWPWGEEGFSCDAHRSQLEQQAASLGRAIAIEPLAEAATRKEYQSPAIVELSPEVGQLRMRVAELEQEHAAKDERIAELTVSLRKANLGLAPDAATTTPAEAETPREGRSPDPSSTPR